jgi:hypothetical protein
MLVRGRALAPVDSIHFSCYKAHGMTPYGRRQTPFTKRMAEDMHPSQSLTSHDRFLHLPRRSVCQTLSAKLARVIRWTRACILARMDAIRLMETRKPRLAICSTKWTCLSNPVRSFRWNRLDFSPHNRCEANNRGGVFESQTRGSCQRGDRPAKLTPCRDECAQ